MTAVLPAPAAPQATSTPVRRRLRGPRRLTGLLAGLGPAVVAAVAYVDPGNFATNFAAGSNEGYLLVWVVVAANLIAILVQNLSAKLGLATGQSLPEVCREQLRPRTTRGLWAQAEAVTIATDLAEVVGGAIALNLLFGLPLVQGALITAVVAFGLLALHSRGAGRFELVIGGMFAVILVGFLVNLVGADPDPTEVAAGFVPQLAGTSSVMLAVGILGATVMPHVIYLHSGMSATRTSTLDRHTALKRTRFGILLALGLAGLVNLSMLVVAAALFHGDGAPVDTLEGAHAGIATELDATASLMFALALLASGLASTGVGTYAGQVVMAGFLRRRIPIVLRRAASLVPAVIILAAGADPTQALVVSQVVLAFGIPFALVPLIMFTRRRDLMGALVNRRSTTMIAWACAVVVIALNALLLVRTFA